jgi:pimeloyl-ACP methyl ester carboxylesterase
MLKEFIKNRKDQKIAVATDIAKPQRGLAFIMHGLGGFKGQPHLVAMAEAFRENGYTAVLFDTTNTFGESEGNYEDATTTNYYEDLEDVIGWAEGQSWYSEPFFMAGHSLGGICITLFAEKYPEKIKALAPISTVVSGRLSLETSDHKDSWQQWKKVGYEERQSASKPGVIKRLRWSHMEDRFKYDLLPEVNRLTMPVLLIVGENDSTTPLEHQKILYNALSGPKELHIIKGARHTFREENHLKELKDIFVNWLKNL